MRCSSSPPGGGGEVDGQGPARHADECVVGFPLGGLLSLAVAAVAALVLLPAGVQVDTLGQVGLPVAVALGKLGVAVAILGFVAATFGAAIETGLSTGY